MSLSGRAGQMVPPTRRTFLQGATGLATLLTGCSALTDGSAGSTRTPTREAEPAADGPGAGAETDPASVLVRVDGDRQPVWLADPDAADGGRPSPHPEETHLESWVVDDAARADRVTVADGVDARRVEAFLDGTDFAAETVYVETVRVDACFRLELCHVRWTPTEVSTDYARAVRPYDEECAVDERVFETRLVRIPDAIDADDVHSYASSIGSGTCDRRRARAVAEGGSGSGPTTPGSQAESGSGTDTAATEVIPDE